MTVVLPYVFFVGWVVVSLGFILGAALAGWWEDR